MSRQEMETISWRDFTLKRGAYQFNEAKEWEKVRFLAYIEINSQIPKGKPGVKLEKIIKLPTDEVSPNKNTEALKSLTNFIQNG